MTQGWLQIALFLVVLVALTPLLGGYMARVYTGELAFLAPVERLFYRAIRADVARGQDWKAYARSLLVFSGLFWLGLYLILRTQTLHPFNPQGFHSPTWDVTFNTVSSFITNTNWQFYGGETTMTYFSQMAGLAVQNFVSAAVGICVAVALIRGSVARSGTSLGNFWQDVVRTLLYVLLPISVLGALLLVSQGVIQTFSGSVVAHGQHIALGPVATQEIIKELGTNGGGFFNTNSAMPFENPNGLTNFIEMLAMLAIPAGLTATYGRMVGNRRQGWAIFSAMAILFVIGVAVAYAAEQHGTPAQHLAGVHGPNLEGKEQRFGIAGSSLWTAVTTVTSTGAVNSAFESLTGLGGAVPFANLSMSEVVFGGVGTGLYSMLIFVLLAVFIGGLMVGRTPEYLGKKIGPRDMKLIVLASLFTPLTVLMTSATAIAAPAGRASITAAGPEGFSQNLYAYLSQANNNGSAWAGFTGYVQPHPGNLGAHGVTFADLLGGLTMVFARFAPIVLVLAVAGSLAAKRIAPAGPGTLRTDSPTFVVLLIGVIVLVGALTFFPAILLGPVVQSLTTRLF